MKCLNVLSEMGIFTCAFTDEYISLAERLGNNIHRHKYFGL